MKSGPSGCSEFSDDLFFTLVEKSSHLITRALQFAATHTCKSVVWSLNHTFITKQNYKEVGYKSLVTS